MSSSEMSSREVPVDGGGPSIVSPASHGAAEATQPGLRTFKVGLLGYGTVGAAFAALLEQRAVHVERITGRMPVLSEALTTSKGSFPEILESSDAIVELIGGIEPARE